MNTARSSGSPGKRLGSPDTPLAAVLSGQIICGPRRPPHRGGAGPTCLFCLQKFAASQEAALRWGWEVLGDPEHVDWYVDDCGCTEGAGSLLWPVNTAASPIEDVALCFSCGAVYAEVKDR